MDDVVNESVPVLNRPTLVLNRGWQPVHVTHVARAITMICNDVARAVDPEEFRMYAWSEWVGLPVAAGVPCVRSAKLRVRAPEVIVASAYDRQPLQAVTFSRRNVIKWDHYTCVYCGAQPGVDGLTIDHVVPKAQGGANSWTNCVAACVACNSRKADRTPHQAGMRLRREPHRPAWKAFYSLQGARVESWARFIDPVAPDAARTA